MARGAAPPTSVFDIRVHRWWGGVLLATLLWHSVHVATSQSPDYLLFACYVANLLLGLGVLMGSSTLTGTGFNWVLPGYLLWLHYIARTSDWEPSGAAMHTSGLVVGLLTMRFHRYPRYVWVLAFCLGGVLHLLARLLTDPLLNVNAAFRVYEGWEPLFSSIVVYRVVTVAALGILFIVLTWINRTFTSLRGLQTRVD